MGVADVGGGGICISRIFAERQHYACGCCMKTNAFESLHTSRFSEIDDAHGYTEYMSSTRIRIGIFTEYYPKRSEFLVYLRK